MLGRAIICATAVLALGQDSRGNTANDPSLEAALARLQQVIMASKANLEAQEKAWPTRERDQENEWPTPFNVQKLERSQRDLEREKEQVLRQLEKDAVTGISSFLAVLSGAEDPALADALLPLVLKYGKEHERTTQTLLELAKRFSPCPLSVVKGLASLESQEAGLLLLELGKKEKNHAILVAAGNRSELALLGQLIDLAEGEDAVLAKASLRAIARLSPPSNHSRNKVDKPVRTGVEQLRARDRGLTAIAKVTDGFLHTHALKTLVSERIQKARSPQLKAALIVYLGLFADEAFFPLFVSLYTNHAHGDVRLAVINAMGMVGPVAGEFLKNELARPDNTLTLRKGCIQALGTCRYRDATGTLIASLDDPRLKRDAARSLRRIAGEDLGDKTVVWERWWRTQPEAPPSLLVDSEEFEEGGVEAADDRRSAPSAKRTRGQDTIKPTHAHEDGVGVDVTIEAAEVLPPTPGIRGAEPGHFVLTLQVKVTNHQTEPLLVMPVRLDLRILYGGVTLAKAFPRLTAYREPTLRRTSLDPSESLSGWLTFDVPEEAKELTLETDLGRNQLVIQVPKPKRPGQ